MQMAQQLLRQANCPLHCPQEMKVGNDITHRVKIKDDYIRKDGTCAIYIQCFVRGTQVRIPTGINVKPAEFDKRNQRIRKNHPLAIDYNLMLDEMLGRVHELRVKYRLGQIKLNPEVFSDLVTQSSINTDFLAYMIWKINQRKSEIGYGTWKHHKSVHTILKEWRENIPFSAISEKLFWDFKKRLEARGNNVNTIDAKIKCIKTYLNAAIRDGFKFEFPEKALKRVQVKSKVKALTTEEVKALITLYKEEYLPDHMQQTLRCFLFSCFTGLRYSDVAQLRHEHIIGNYIVIHMAKTKKQGSFVKVQISKPARMFLDFHQERPLGKVISNQKMNDNLKIVQKYIGTDTRLSFHVSRHTFATMFLELGGQVEVLQTLLGHSKISTTMIYAHVVDKRRDEQMSNFNKLL